MKVYELIKELERFDGDTEVYYNDTEYGAWDIDSIEKGIKATLDNNTIDFWRREQLEDLDRTRKDELELSGNDIINEEDVIILS